MYHVFRERPTYLIYTMDLHICLNEIIDTRERNKRGNVYVYGLADPWKLGKGESLQNDSTA